MQIYYTLPGAFINTLSRLGRGRMSSKVRRVRMADGLKVGASGVASFAVSWSRLLPVANPIPVGVAGPAEEDDMENLWDSTESGGVKGLYSEPLEGGVPLKIERGGRGIAGGAAGRVSVFGGTGGGEPESIS